MPKISPNSLTHSGLVMQVPYPNHTIPEERLKACKNHRCQECRQLLHELPKKLEEIAKSMNEVCSICNRTKPVVWICKGHVYRLTPHISETSALEDMNKSPIAKPELQGSLQKIEEYVKELLNQPEQELSFYVKNLTKASQCYQNHIVRLQKKYNEIDAQLVLLGQTAEDDANPTINPDLTAADAEKLIEKMSWYYCWTLIYQNILNLTNVALTCAQEMQ